MIYKFKNKTSSLQQIMFIDGSSIKVSQKEEIEIDEDTMYKEEFERCKRFFDIQEVEIKIEQKRVYKKREPIEIPEEIETYGGDE